MRATRSHQVGPPKPAGSHCPRAGPGLTATVTPPLAPESATLGFEIDAGPIDVIGDNDTPVITLPAGEQCALALDAGPDLDTIPPFEGYRRLLPATGWDPARLVFDGSARTLRVRVPAGAHEAYLLVGDTEWLPVHATYVRSGGTLLAKSEAVLAGGVFSWLHFRLDGGPSGSDIDLELSSDPGHQWKLNAFVLINGSDVDEDH